MTLTLVLHMYINSVVKHPRNLDSVGLLIVLICGPVGYSL